MSNSVMVIGDGPAAQTASQTLLAQGTELICVARASHDASPMRAANTQSPGLTAGETISPAWVTACSGSLGDYRITLQTERHLMERRVGQVVIAEEASRRPQFDTYQIAPHEGHVLALSDMQAALEDRAQTGTAWLEKDQTTVFLVGLAHDTYPLIFEETMRAAGILRQHHNHTVYILTGNLKVGDDGLEELYQHTRRHGVRYVKFTDSFPTLRQENDHIWRITFDDEIAQQALEIRPDVIVVDEAIEPSPYLQDLIRLFELEQDQYGFAQADNVYRLTARTNRNGIYVIGPSRGAQPPRATACDAADSAMICLNAFDAPLDPPAEARAVIDRRQCIRCLTCYRLCPYRAVQLENPMRVAPAACAQCGICVAECPRSAIDLPGVAAADIRASLKTAPLPEVEGAHEPVLVVLGCARSAIHAGQTAACLGEKFTPGLHCIEIPCVGSVSQQVLLEILHGHADGVLVIGCHPENCHSTQGTLRARQCVRTLRQLLPGMGIDAARIQYRTLAANMAGEFTRMISAFRDQIRALAPNMLRSPEPRWSPTDKPVVTIT